MLRADECQMRARECGRMAEETVNPIQKARFLHLERSWLYLARLKLKIRGGGTEGQSA